MCRGCGGPCHVLEKEVLGTFVRYSYRCDSCTKQWSWASQPKSQQLPLGNLILAAAAFFTACSPTRFINLCRQAGIACFSISVYNLIQTSYLVPAVRNVWQQAQERLFAARRGRPVKLAGDGRCDSPGHCAKYGSYTVMDTETNEVLHCELIQVILLQLSSSLQKIQLKK